MKKRRLKAIIALGLAATLLAGGTVAAFAAPKMISKSKAKTLALKAVNVKKTSVTKWGTVKLDNYDSDNDREWEVVFRTKNYRYEVELDAVTGKVEDIDKNRISKTTKTISKSEAKKIALERANVKSSSVKTWTKVKLDNYDDDNDKEWEIKFKTKNYKYEVEIDARTGKVEDFDKEKIAKSSKYIGIDKAKKIALDHAKVSNVSFVKAKLDEDDGVYYYDIEFKKNGVEYEYEINAKTGKIIDWDKDLDD